MARAASSASWSTQWARTEWRAWAVGALLLVGGLVGAGMMSVSCSEKPSGRSGSGACEAVIGSLTSCLAAVLWPVAVFAASQAIPHLRQRFALTVVSIAVVATLFWVSFLLVANSG